MTAVMVGSPKVVDLVARAQAGDPDAYGQLYQRYQDTVFRYVWRRVGATHRALAEDLTQETFARAMRRIGGFTWQGRDIGAWFVTIARNLVADHYKSGRFRLEVTHAESIEPDDRDDPSARPDRIVEDRLTSRVLRDAVAKLGDEQRTCIELRFLRQLSVHETAVAMGKQDGAIKALQYRAVRALARMPEVVMSR